MLNDVTYTEPAKIFGGNSCTPKMSELYDSSEDQLEAVSHEIINPVDEFMLEVKTSTDSLTRLVSIAKELRKKEQFDELSSKLRSMGYQDEYNDNAVYRGMHELFSFMASANFQKSGTWDLGTKVTGTSNYSVIYYLYVCTSFSCGSENADLQLQWDQERKLQAILPKAEA